MSYGDWFAGVSEAWTSTIQGIEQQPTVVVTQMDTTDSSHKNKKKHSHWNNMVDGAKSIADDALDGIETIGKDIGDMGSDIYHGAVNVAKNTYHAGEELAQTELGHDIVTVGDAAFHGAENLGKSAFSGLENLGKSAFNGVENVGHKIGNIGSDIEHIVLVGGGLLLAGAILWSSKDENRQWAYEKGGQLYQKGKTAAEAALIL